LPKFKVGDVIAPVTATKGVEYLILEVDSRGNYMYDEYTILLLTGPTSPFSAAKGYQIELIEIIDSQGIFICKATQAEAVLYGNVPQSE